MQQPTDMAYEVPLVTVRYARHLIRFLERRGIGRQVLVDHGVLDEKLIQNPDAFLSMRQISGLLEQARFLLPDERDAFLFGQNLDLVAHGILGFTLLKRRTQRELVSMVVQHIRVALPLMDMDVNCAGESVHIRLSDIWCMGALRPFVVKIYMGSIHALASLVCKRFRFEFDFPANLPKTDWQALAEGSEMVFGAESNQVVMLLSDSMPRYDDTRLPYIVADAQSPEKREEAGSIMEVVMRVRQCLLNNPGRRATLAQVAEQLEMSPRSVRRHLGLAGFSFHDIRAQIRETFATRYLKDTRVTLPKIAEMLGYSDQASFTKAYRAWTGKTPGNVRKNALHSARQL